MTTPSDDLQRLLAEEPFVRRLAQQLVRQDADDVVQQTWLRAMTARPALLRRPRQWLASVVRSLAVDRRRQVQRQEARETATARTDDVPSSTELLALEERRRELVAAVNALPASLRTIVLLRFYEGLPPRRIAARLSLPVTTVSNRLHAALQELRHRLDARHGARSAWLAAFAPIAASPCQLPWREVTLSSANAGIGVITMTKTKFVFSAAIAVILAVSVAIAWPVPPASTAPPLPPGDRVAQVVAPLPAASAEAATAVPMTRDAAVHRPAATTGTLLVHVRHAEAPHEAAGVVTKLVNYDAPRRTADPSAITDGSGTARYEALPPGQVGVVAVSRPTEGVRATIEAGAVTEVELRLPAGLTVNGIVVDATGTPVGGALIEVSMPAMRVPLASPGVTRADGTFKLRDCETTLVIGARAAGHAASAIHLLQGKAGTEKHVRIELRAGGGIVAGQVVDPDGQPVAGAIVQVGDGAREGIMANDQGAPAAPAEATSDAEGRFQAIGVANGTQRVLAVAKAFAPWSGSCEVGAATAPLRIVMTRGVTVHGVVRDASGSPLAAVCVQVGEIPDLVRFEASSADDGSFVIEGLPVGESRLVADSQQHGKGTATVSGNAGETVTCELRLEGGSRLRGRVVDDTGSAVRNVDVVLDAEGTPRWSAVAHTDAHGAFSTSCPTGRTLKALIRHRDYLPFEQTRIDPAHGEVLLRPTRDTSPRAKVTGRLLRPDGVPAAGNWVHGYRADVPDQSGAKVGDDGSFAFEVPAGTWAISVSEPDLAKVRLRARALRPGEIWDVGTLRFQRGGTLVVTGASESMALKVVELDGYSAAHISTGRATLRSERIPPGNYLLLVRGDGIAAHAMPVSIRDGEETTVEVSAKKGVRQQIVFAAGPGTKLEDWIQYRVDREGQIVARLGSASDRNAVELGTKLWLAPGAYTLCTENREPPGTATFTVGETESPVVRIVLQ